MKKLFMVVCAALLFSIVNVHSQEFRKPIDVVNKAKSSNKSFQKIGLLTVDSRTSRNDLGIESNIVEYNIFNVNNNGLRQVQNSTPEALNLSIPTTYRNEFELELVKVNIFSDDFSVVQRSDNSVADVSHGVHYRGIIKGDPTSIAAISIFNNEIMGLISSDAGNLVVGKLSNSDKHIIYDDYNVITDLGLECGTIDDDISYKDKDLRYEGNNRSVGDCIRLYIEVDKDIHDNKGGITGATNYTTGLLNEVITLYANEGIQAVLSQIVVWNVTSPYSSTSSSGMLSDFQANTSSINGDLGQLLSYQASGGIAAGFNGICNPNVNSSLSFSSINSSYSVVPTYSWSVMVVTHEFGHLWGSRHTHACVWNGNNTAIDGCAGSTEGSCAVPGFPSQGGTLMSYCHLQSVGINFNEGFGPQPGNVIRNSVNNASCTSSCGPATCDDGYQNGEETGIDCGGPDCPDCPTCSDGIQNGDETGVDCGGSVCAPCPCLDNGVTLTINLDNYPEETRWEIKSGNTVVASGGTYGSQPDGSTVAETACLPDGCYDFVIYDSYGDGICCGYGIGDYILTKDSDGSTLASGAAFGFSETTNFCVNGSSAVLGCTDPTAHNYDSNANQDDGSCETCSDGAQNGDETGVDCGGTNPNCVPCTTVIPGCTDPTAHNYDSNANQDDGSCETCNDGAQNGDETGVDCGGSNPNCGPCVVLGCTDASAHNYNPNANQDDGSCETCNDGTQNGDEEGVDCGGSNLNCVPCSTACTYQVIDFNDFNTSWGIWNDGGSDCRRSSNDANYAVGGTGRPVRIRDNTNTSTFSTDNLNLSGYSELTVSFSYYPRSMDNANEDFWLQISTNGGASYTTVEEWNRGDEFENDNRYNDAVVITGPFTSNTRLRFRCDASTNADYVYIDDVEISGCISGGTSLENPSEREILTGVTSLSLAPNPTNDILNITYELPEASSVEIMVTDINGKAISMKSFNREIGIHNDKLNVNDYTPGVYVVHMLSKSQRLSKKFVVIE